MMEFIENGGFIGDKKLQVRNFKTPSKKKVGDYEPNEEGKQVMRSKSYQQEDTEAETMTPKEKMILKKKKMAEENAKQLADHARGAIDNYSTAKKKLNDEYSISGYHNGKLGAGHKSYTEDSSHENMKGSSSKYYRTDKYSNNIVIGDPKAVMISNYTEEQNDKSKSKRSTKESKHEEVELEGSSQFGDSFAANDR